MARLGTWMGLAGYLALATPAEAGKRGEAPVDRPRPVEGALSGGDPAPQVDVVMPDGTPTQLLDKHTPGRPLVLIFGSFT